MILPAGVRTACCRGLENQQNNSDIAINDDSRIDNFNAMDVVASQSITQIQGNTQNTIVSSRSLKKYFVHVSNSDKVDMLYALLVFANGQQVDFSPSSGGSVYFYEQRKKSINVIPSTILHNSVLNSVISGNRRVKSQGQALLLLRDGT